VASSTVLRWFGYEGGSAFGTRVTVPRGFGYEGGSVFGTRVTGPRVPGKSTVAVHSVIETTAGAGLPSSSLNQQPGDGIIDA